MPDTLLHDAVIYDQEEKRLLGPIEFNDDTSQQFPAERFHLYCTHCFQNNPRHFTRLKRVTENGVLKGLGLFDRKNSTHQCDHATRYVDLTRSVGPVPSLVARYGAGHIRKDHRYTFPVHMAGALTQAVVAVDKASRLAKLTYAIMYDEGLRDRQHFQVGGECLSLEQLFDENASDMRTPRAFFFNPVARADVRLKNAWQNYEIIGMGNTSIMAGNHVVFEALKHMTERRGGNKSAPILGFARSKLVYDVYLGKSMFRQFQINSIDQVSLWNQHTDFDQALRDQAPPPKTFEFAT